MELGTDTKAVLVATGLIFLWALALGVWKYRQMATSEDHLAHPYVDVAHRAALLYSFAALLIAAFVELSAFSTTVNLLAAFALIFFFAAAIAGYCYQGWKAETTNQFADPIPGTHPYMYALILAEIGGFAVLFAGFLDAQIL
ncbi:MAG: hypothetical protein ACR2OC_01355 [Solirubrobacterales bacterium]